MVQLLPFTAQGRTDELDPCSISSPTFDYILSSYRSKVEARLCLVYSSEISDHDRDRIEWEETPSVRRYDSYDWIGLSTSTDASYFSIPHSFDNGLTDRLGSFTGRDEFSITDYLDHLTIIDCIQHSFSPTHLSSNPSSSSSSSLTSP